VWHSKITALVAALLLLIGPSLGPADDNAGQQPATAKTTKPEPAIAKVQELGGTVEVDDQSPRKLVIKVDLYETKVADADLEILAGLTHLRELRLSRTDITDAGLKHLKGLIELQYLNISHTKITDAGLEQLKDLTGLQTLHITNFSVTDAGLKHLKGLVDLRYLNLCLCAQVTDAGMEHLKGLAKLQRLDLDSALITHAGLKQLRGLADLKVLHLGDTKLSDVEFHELQRALPKTNIHR
jgi:Leucine-rich repeat (LRR) protein